MWEGQKAGFMAFRAFNSLLFPLACFSCEKCRKNRFPAAVISHLRGELGEGVRIVD
jgi:hypothetical protein